jgi:NAD(P)H-hydrate epimerase
MSGVTTSPKLEALWSAAQARAADAYTIERLGVPGLVLMEHAGKGIADVVKARRPARVVVVAGPGNNGGDGWVVARHLWNAGVPCPVVTLRAPDALTGDASRAAQMFLVAAEARGWTDATLGAPFLLLDLADDLAALLARMAPDVVVDAVFGTGLSRPAEGIAARAIDAMNASSRPLVAVDLPSGLPTDGEAPAGPCVNADVTVTFGGRKIAHASEPGRARCGRVVVVDIGLFDPPDAAPAVHALVDARGLVPAVDVGAHKNRYGHVAVVVGRSPGAARLAARASLRSGAGLASLVVDGAFVAPEPELMTRPLDARALDNIAALVVGPGLGHENAARAKELLARAAAAKIPVVVDAEGVDVLAAGSVPGLVAVATPHPGEAARALGTTSAQIQKDRPAAARALRARLGVDVVLKGSCPLVALESGLVVVEGGAPALAVAGSGDVLAGCIGGLLARGLPAAHALLAGVEAHQRAGQALSTKAARGALAGEIADALPAAFGP